MIDYWALYIIFSIRVSLNIIASIDLIRFTLPVAFSLTYTLYCFLHISSSRFSIVHESYRSSIYDVSPTSFRSLYSFINPSYLIFKSLLHHLRSLTHTNTHTQSWLHRQDADWWHSWVFNWERRALSVYKREECTLWQVDCSPHYAHYMT